MIMFRAILTLFEIAMQTSVCFLQKCLAKRNITPGSLLGVALFLHRSSTTFWAQKSLRSIKRPIVTLRMSINWTQK